MCDKTFNIEHALSCLYGGFLSICHNEIRDITAHLMSDVCHNVGTEPVLQPVTDESLTNRTANIEDGARLDVKAQGFWGNDRQCAFFDVRVFNPFAHTYRNLPLTTCYRRNEQEKRRAYDQRVREIEHGCFSPLVVSASGGMGPTAKVVYKKLASMIATKHNQYYSQTLIWLCCRLSFSLLRSAIMCLRGSRSSANSLPSHSYKKLPLIVPSATAEWPPDSDIIIILSLFFFSFLFLFRHCKKFSRVGCCDNSYQLYYFCTYTCICITSTYVYCIKKKNY